MTQMVTRCPKCATAFRITSTQLESAKGAVRCGSCLHIFKAQDYLVKSASTAATSSPHISHTTQASAKPKTLVIKAFEPTKTPAASKPLIDKTKALADEEDVLISDDMDAATEKASPYDFDGFFDVEMQPKQTVSLFEREIRFEEPKDDTDEADADESWAEHLLADDDESQAPLKKSIGAAKPASTLKTETETTKTDAPLTPATAAQHPLDSYAPADEQQSNERLAEPTNTYTGPLFSLVDDTAGETHTEPHADIASSAPESAAHETTQAHHEPVFSEAFLSATRTPDAATADSSAFAAALFDAEPASNAYDEPEKPSGKRPAKSSKLRAFDSSRAALLMNIMPAPLEFTAKRMRRWYQKKLWASLAILMSAALFAQIAYFKFEYFSRVEPYRTLYLFTCPLLGCNVPALIDSAQIEATNLIVRNHPEAANALLVDAILINKAPFEQPFPDLILSFSTLNDVPVASRRFTPKEYLFGELAGMTYIPMHQPVHITLEISDPGPDAPNYTLITH